MSTAFRVILEGDQEVPATGSKASGLGTVIFDSDPVTPTASYSITVEGVDFGTALGDKPQTPKTGDDVTRVHFHNQESGVNGGIVFGQISPADDENDLSIVLNKDHSWTVSGVWDTTDGAVAPGSASITNASTIPPFLTFDTILGTATVGTEVPLYFNVHTLDHLGGEIRGQLVAIADDGDNTVRGTAGDDLLPGLGGNDIMFGGDGKDVMDGGIGNDSLTGGDDADRFVFNADFGMDIITDLKGPDQIQFEGLFPDSEAVLAASRQVGDDVVITWDENNTITLLDVNLNTLQAHDFLILA
jgi:serralysin